MRRSIGLDRSDSLVPDHTTSAANVAGTFMQPVSLYGLGFGPPVGRPFTASFGARFEF